LPPAALTAALAIAVRSLESRACSGSGHDAITLGGLTAILATVRVIGLGVTMLLCD